ncbi:hypothetical protein V8G54_019312 [Vigna mungo]|uniref:Uncharacterized protein n=1 Tax=Vigna mungo TaxID=3915 RepID=A0AAQ3NAN3_VIGMU
MTSIPPSILLLFELSPSHTLAFFALFEFFLSNMRHTAKADIFDGFDFRARRNSCITHFVLARELPLAFQKTRTLFFPITCSSDNPTSSSFSTISHCPFPSSLLSGFPNTRLLTS